MFISSAWFKVKLLNQEGEIVCKYLTSFVFSVVLAVVGTYID